jgi:arabinan endo-1,5-alpha-L-arabinosidase
MTLVMRRLVLLLLAACSSVTGDPQSTPDTGSTTPDADVPCTTVITYGSSWIRSPGHDDTSVDIAIGDVTWDGICHAEGNNSFAVLSNGWKPYFEGKGTCAIAIDSTCSAERCSTRITYGTPWIHAADHPAQYDDVDGRVFWDGTCSADNSATLSNGWAPHFTSSCDLSLRWNGCGGLYVNPVIAKDCPDPGVTRDGDRYILSCTSGNATNAFPLYVSTDLIRWTPAGHILPTAKRPAWAKSDFWAPEIHKVGANWVAYFSARGADGKLSIGAASATDPLGPYTALAQPLVPATTVGLIDASAFTVGNASYLLWKEDGNAQNAPTPIRARALAANGLSVTGNTSTLITNDQTWEGNLVEAPFVVEHSGMYYLFYSGNAYFDNRYAVGVARAASPLGPYTKAPAPIVTSNATWIGPGHCSVVDDYMIYHAWNATHDARMVLVDQIQWTSDGWPRVYSAPSKASRPLP